MITYPNQKVIQVKSMPHNGKDKSQPYGCINIEASNRVARVLKPNAYRMYIRIVLNQDGHEFALSPKAMHEEIGISPTGFETAVKNLNFELVKDIFTSATPEYVADQILHILTQNKEI